MKIRVLDEDMKVVLDGFDLDSVNHDEEKITKVLYDIAKSYEEEQYNLYIFFESKLSSMDRYSGYPEAIYFYNDESDDNGFVDGLDLGDYGRYFERKYKDEKIARIVMDEYINSIGRDFAFYTFEEMFA